MFQLQRVLEWGHQHTLGRIFPYSQNTREFLDGDQYGLLILLKKNRFQIPENGAASFRFVVQGSPRFTGAHLLNLAKPRGSLIVRAMLDGQLPIVVANTHLSLGAATYLKFLEMREFASHLAELTGLGERVRAPTLIGVDTNSEHHTPEMQWLFSNTDLVDLYHHFHPNLEEMPHRGSTWNPENPYTQVGFTADEPAQRLDFHLFAPGQYQDTPFVNYQIISSDIVFDRSDSIISDHYGVFSKLRLQPSCAALLGQPSLLVR